MIMKTYRNRKNGQEVTQQMEHAVALQRIVDNDPDSWLLFWVHKMANEMEQANDVKHATEMVGNMFLYAAGRGLQRPRISLVYDDRRYLLYLSKQGTLCMKRSIRRNGDKFGEAVYLGWISGGRIGWGRERRNDSYDQVFVDHLLADPIPFMAECSKDVGVCCYCNQPLTDERSMKAGYGETCSKNWGLPWGKRDYPSFSELFTRSDELRSNLSVVVEARKAAAAALAVVEDAKKREDANDLVKAVAAVTKAVDEEVFAWSVLSDWLQERSIPSMKRPANIAKEDWVGPCVMRPNPGVVLPREC